jgi:chromosome segregation ATPase
MFAVTLIFDSEIGNLDFYFSGQLRRIHQLEDNYNQLRKEHDDLVQRVNQNETNYNQDKQEHKDEIYEMKQRFEAYRLEIEEYKRKISKTIADLEAKLERLNEKQEEHGISIKDLSLQRDTLNKLSQQIEEIINARRLDLDKLDKFTKRLDDINDLLNQVREGLYPLSKIPSLEQELAEIRNLLIQPNTIKELELRVSQAQRDIVRHNGDLEQINGKLYTFETSYQQLKLRIDDIKDNDLRTIRQRLDTIDADLERKSFEINQANKVAQGAVDRIDQLHEILASIREKLSDLENIKLRPNALEMKPDNSLIDQILQEQNRIRSQLENLANIEQQLNELTIDLNDLKRRVDDLSKPVTVNNEPDDRNRRSLEDSLKEFIRQIQESVLNLNQQLVGQISEAETLINFLKTQLDAFLNAQQQKLPEIPSIIQEHVSPSSKVMPYVESLQPIDLLQDIWAKYSSQS